MSTLIEMTASQPSILFVISLCFSTIRKFIVFKVSLFKGTLVLFPNLFLKQSKSIEISYSKQALKLKIPTHLPSKHS